MSGSLWLELLVRSAVLLAAGEALRAFGKRASAASRYRLLLWTFVLLATLPVLAVIFPEVRLLERRTPAAQTASVTVQEISSKTAHDPSRGALNLGLIVWLAGVLLASAPMGAGALAVSRIARRAAKLTTPALSAALRKFAALPSSDAEVFASSEIRVPVTCGLMRSRILLPEAAANWSCSRLESVLAHEFAHVRRRDVLAQIGVHMVAALWWFQPLVWISRRNLRAESEFACDAEAVALGLRPSEYAAELVGVAKTAGRELRVPSAAISMLRSSNLEGRVRAVLSLSSTGRKPLRACAVALVLGSVAIAASAVSLSSQESSHEGASTMKRTIMAALLASAGLSAATISGDVSDSGGNSLSGVKVILSNPDKGTEHEAVTGTDGKFSFADGDAGQYILRLEKPGFTSIFRVFDLKAEFSIDREFTMSNEGGRPVADKVVSGAEDQAKPVRVGGGVEESNLTTKVQPIYPAAAKAAHVQGTVEIEATISKQGLPTELRVLSSPSDDLSESAVEAVRQWRYRPTLLNGDPIEVVTDVIVNYTLTH
jgi:TonB family protein